MILHNIHPELWNKYVYSLDAPLNRTLNQPVDVKLWEVLTRDLINPIINSQHHQLVNQLINELDKLDSHLKNTLS